MAKTNWTLSTLVGSYPLGRSLFYFKNSTSTNTPTNTLTCDVYDVSVFMVEERLFLFCMHFHIFFGPPKDGANYKCLFNYRECCVRN